MKGNSFPFWKKGNKASRCLHLKKGWLQPISTNLKRGIVWYHLFPQQITGHWPSKRLSGLWLHNRRNYGRTVKFSLKRFFSWERGVVWEEQRDFFSREISQDFAMITAPSISTPHITEVQALSKPNAKQQHTIGFSNTETGTREEARV